MENQRVLVVLVMDLSTAFNTVGHQIHLNILSKHFGFTQTALQWFSTYLSPHSFKVCIEGNYSKPKTCNLVYCKGQLLGPVFLCYASHIKLIVLDGLTLNGFADDHSVRSTSKGNNQWQKCAKKISWKTA